MTRARELELDALLDAEAEVRDDRATWRAIALEALACLAAAHADLDRLQAAHIHLRSEFRALRLQARLAS